MIRSHRIKAFLLRHLYEIRATLDRKADIFFWPVIDLLAFGLLAVYINRFDVNPGITGVIIGGLIFWSLVYNIQRDITVSILEEAWSRNLYNLLSTPLQVSEIILGTLILSGFKAIISAVVILVLAASLFGFNLLALGGVMAFYIISIFVFGWAFGYLTSALIFRFGLRLQILAWSLIAVIYPISGVFYPLSVLPEWLASIARAFPISHVFEGLRAIILTGQYPSAEQILIITILDLVYLIVGIWLFVLGFRNAKARGWFIHPA